MAPLARSGSGLVRTARMVYQSFVAAVGRLDKSLSPSDTITKLRKHSFTPYDLVYAFHFLLACLWLTIMQVPPFPYKLIIPTLYAIALLIPFTSQFFFRAMPVLAWVLTFYSNQFLPNSVRPRISVSLLPTLESVLYGANISDLLTRFTHPILDIIAWIPYGVVHFIFPVFVAAFLWLFRPKRSLHLWARVFGYLNLTGVIIQIIFPCAPPWYELIYGLTPANYSIRGSAGGLGRIDALFGSNGYEKTFSNSPVVFGAFPSLHAGNATLEALFISHFFPWATKYIWAYAGILYWATMYLTHHYLIDVVGGACLATAFFYVFLPDEFRGAGATQSPTSARNKYEQYDLDAPRATHRANGNGSAAGLRVEDFELSDADSDEEEDITKTYARSPIAPQHKQQSAAKGGDIGRSHRHTASIASLIREGERGAEEGWSPIGGTFSFPSTPTNANATTTVARGAPSQTTAREASYKPPRTPTLERAGTPTRAETDR